MNCTDGPHPPDPSLTPEQELMLELGWMELWHAVREESLSAGPVGDETAYGRCPQEALGGE